MLKADATGADFSECKMVYADLSYAKIEGAILQDADLQGANLHAIADAGAKWSGANTKNSRKTDKDRLAGETWQIPK